MAVIEGGGAWRGLNQALVKKGQEDAPTLEQRVGAKWDALCAAIRETVELNGGKACTGEVTLKIKVRGCRTENEEVEMSVTPILSGKVPEAPLPQTRVYLDHDAIAHTQPVQVNLPIMGIKGAVEGGKNKKNDSASEEKPKKGQSI